MTRYFCDRCEEEVRYDGDLSAVKYFPVKSGTAKMAYICDNCRTQLLDWFEKIRRDKMNQPAPATPIPQTEPLSTPQLWSSDLD